MEHVLFKPLCLACAIMTGLAACTPAASSNAELATLLAQEVRLGREARGEAFFDLFSLRDTKSDGDTLVTEISVSDDLVSQFRSDSIAFENDFRGVFFEDICDEPNFGRIISLGGTISYQFFSQNGQFLTSINTSDCGT